MAATDGRPASRRGLRFSLRGLRFSLRGLRFSLRGKVFLFDASAAHDPDGDGVAITWDLGDGTRRTGAVIKHRYAAPGDYVVTVEAQDSTGLACGVATDTTTVTARGRF